MEIVDTLMDGEPGKGPSPLRMLVLGFLLGFLISKAFEDPPRVVRFRVVGDDFRDGGAR